MNRTLATLEKQLKLFVSPRILRCLSRKVTDDCIVLSSHSSTPLSIHLFNDAVYLNFADECEEFDIINVSKTLPTLEIVGSLINELMTGSLIYERVYHGTVQTKCRVMLINEITKHRISIRDTVVNSKYPADATRLVLLESIHFH